MELKNNFMEMHHAQAINYCLISYFGDRYALSTLVRKSFNAMDMG